MDTKSEALELGVLYLVRIEVSSVQEILVTESGERDVVQGRERIRSVLKKN
jgi:hypothetical protein